MLPGGFSSKSLLFITTHFQLSKKITIKTPAQIIFSNQTTYYKFVFEHITAFLQIAALIFAYVQLICIRNWKTEHFQHTQAEQLEWKVPHWILV